MMNSFRWSYVPKKPWSNPPISKLHQPAVLVCGSFFFKTTPSGGRPFVAPAPPMDFRCGCKTLPGFVLWVFLDNQSWTDRSLVVKKPTPPSKKCAPQNWIMNPPGFGVKWNFQKNALKFHRSWKSRHFLNNQKQARLSAAPTISLASPDPKLPSGMGRPLQNDAFLTPSLTIWYAKQHHELWIVPPPKKNNFSVLNSSILDNLHIWRIYLADFLHPPGMFVTRECLQPSQSLEKIWHSWHHQVVQNSEHIHSLNLTVRPWK